FLNAPSATRSPRPFTPWSRWRVFLTALARSSLSLKSPAWRATSLPCRTSSFLTASALTKAERFGACSAPPASVRNSRNDWPPEVAGSDLVSLNRAWRFELEGSSMVPQLVAILVFVVVAAVVFVAFSLLDERKERSRVLRDRLADTQQMEGTKPLEEIAFLRDEMLSEIPALDNLLRRSERVSALQKLLSQADIPTRAGNFVLLCLGAAVLLGGIVLVWSKILVFAWVGFLLGFFIPYSYASFRRTKRFNEFEEHFPEEIDTLARAVRAGHAFTTALEMISDEMAEPVAGEFRKLYEEQKFGLPVREALT